MLYEGQTDAGLKCIASVRNRYDGLKRNPYNEAECGHHYGRAMISWAELLALTGFHYSAVDEEMIVAPKNGTFFWSTGYAYGTVSTTGAGSKRNVSISTLGGSLRYKKFTLDGFGTLTLDTVKQVDAGGTVSFAVAAR
jgi:hypothetical protein